MPVWQFLLGTILWITTDLVYSVSDLPLRGLQLRHSAGLHPRTKILVRGFTGFLNKRFRLLTYLSFNS